MAILNQINFKTKDNRDILIRSAVKEDAIATLNLKRSSIFDEEFQLVSPEEFNRTPEKEEEWIESHINNLCHIAIVAVLGNEVIGLIDFSNGGRQRISHTGEFGMSVDKSVRGLGIGTLLLQSLIDWAKTTDQIEKINLSVHANNDHAQGLYKKLGFVTEGIRKNDIKYGPANYVDTVIMGKVL
jgi:RimJ/RimL family protein N-acetyltransferase